MSKEIAISGGQDEEHQFPVLYAETDPSLREAQDNLGENGVSITELPRIKVPSGEVLQWMIQTLDGVEMQKEIECLILAWKVSRAYWPKPLNEGGKKIPDCTSKDGFTGVGNPGGACADCPFSQFGSAAKGHGQACKQLRRLLLIPPGEILPYILTVPPTSLKVCGQYFLNLYSKKIPYWAVVTRLRLEGTKNEDGVSFARMTFTVVRQLTPEEKAAAAVLHRQMKQLLDPIGLDAADYGGDPGPGSMNQTGEPGLRDSDVPF